MYFADRVSLYNFWQVTNLTHISCI